MTATCKLPATVLALLRAVEEFGPAVEGSKLVFRADIPDHLFSRVRVLQTGIRAALLGRRWFGIGGDGRGTGPADYGALNFGAPIPDETRLLACEGPDGGTWDRIRPEWRANCPDLFESVKTARQ